MKFSPLPCSLVPFRPKYSQHPILKNLSLSSALNFSDQIFSNAGLSSTYPVSLLEPTIAPTSSFRLAQAIVETNHFTYKYPNYLIPVIIPAYNAYENGTDGVIRNVGIYSSDAGVPRKTKNTVLLSDLCVTAVCYNSYKQK
jgi:hypothetical protein